MKQHDLQRFVIILLGIFLTLQSCELEDPTEGINSDDVIQLTAPASELLADGQDRLILTAELGPLAAGDESVSFQTSNGRFLLATEDDGQSVTTAASNKSAQATLVGSNLADDDVVVQATIEAENGELFQATLPLVFQRAYPDNMILTAEKSVIQSDRIDFANISIQLFRDSGTPSDKTIVHFEVIQLDSAQAEIVPFAFSGPDATLTTPIKSSNGLPGVIQLKATAETQDGSTLERVIELAIEE